METRNSRRMLDSETEVERSWTHQLGWRTRSSVDGGGVDGERGRVQVRDV